MVVLRNFHKRAGTENIASIVGMSIALKKSCDEMEKVNKKLLALDEAFNDVLLKSKIDFIRNGSNNHVPGNINLSIRRTSWGNVTASFGFDGNLYINGFGL